MYTKTAYFLNIALLSQGMATEAVVKVLNELREDVRHIKNDVDVLKSIFLEDVVLTKEERKHLDETLHLLKERKMNEFVKIV